MSCCGQKRAEQKRQPAPPAPVANPSGQSSGRARPAEPRISATARLSYLTRNGKLFTR